MITREKAWQLRKVIESSVSAANLTVEAALECVELYPEWEVAKAYTAGQRCKRGGTLYECFQGHTSQADWTPEVAPSLWGAVTVDPATGYDEWVQPTGAHDAYNTGDRVVYAGVVYESLIDGNTYSPEVYPAGWKVVA
ncbi:MAG: hypothetical protein VB111_12500 [Clostridiaceae bacterium]|nr:hypothetical protein [Clostridiaceae bacterium]